MSKSIAAMLLSAALLGGCVIAVPGHLYPVQGALATQVPPPVYTLTMNGIGRSGSLSGTLAGGPVKGGWSVLDGTDPAANKFSAQWDAIYGPGFFVANVLGNPYFCRAALSGSQNLTLDVDFIITVPGQVNSIKGVAIDSQGNLYKLTF
jgi:hypothetical protein